MLSINQRWLLFLFGCILVRLLFVYLARFASSNILKIMGYLALLPAFGFLYLWIFKKRQSGFEAGGEVWWKDFRIVHSILYFMFAYLAVTGNKENAWKVLAIDVTFGLVLFFLHNSQ
jgi:hypothetical protein